MISFESLYSSFLRDEEIAKGIYSPNAQDTTEIKMAIVGFSYNAPTEMWETDEYDFVTRHLSLGTDLSQRERLFYSIGVGYLLGLLRTGKIGDQEFKIALAQLPGFILLKGGNF